MELVIAHKTEILALLLAVSELLALSPKIKANSIFQLLVNLAKKAAGK
jgi:hypothetical protein